MRRPDHVASVGRHHAGHLNRLPARLLPEPARMFYDCTLSAPAPLAFVLSANMLDGRAPVFVGPCPDTTLMADLVVSPIDTHDAGYDIRRAAGHAILWHLQQHQDRPELASVTLATLTPRLRGTGSPWGAIDHVEPVAPGIDLVATPSHGGFRLEPWRIAELPADCRNRSGWYEEDCEAFWIYHHFPDETGLSPAQLASVRSQIKRYGSFESIRANA